VDCFEHDNEPYEKRKVVSLQGLCPVSSLELEESKREPFQSVSSDIVQFSKL